MPPNYTVIPSENEVVLEVNLPEVQSAAELDCDLEDDFIFRLTWGDDEGEPPSIALGAADATYDEAHGSLVVQLPAVDEPNSCRFDRLMSAASEGEIGDPLGNNLVDVQEADVFLDFEFGSASKRQAGRVVIELFNDICPKTAENFRCLCTGERGSDLHYKGSSIHHVFPTWVLEGGSLGPPAETLGGIKMMGSSIYGETFADDSEGASRAGPGAVSMHCTSTGLMSSLFYIELRHCDHCKLTSVTYSAAMQPAVDGKNIVFGRVVEGMQIVRSIEQADREARPPAPGTTMIVKDSDNAVIHPIDPVEIVDCGELTGDERCEIEDHSTSNDGDDWPDYPQDSKIDNPGQLLEAADQIHRCGHVALERQDYSVAEIKLTKMAVQSLRYIERAACCGDTTMQLAVFLDRAVCRYKGTQFCAAVEDCDQVLQADADHIEALYWRGSALLAGPGREKQSTIASLKEAAQDLEKGMKLSCEKDHDQRFMIKLKEVRKRLKQGQKKEKNFYTNMFK